MQLHIGRRLHRGSTVGALKFGGLSVSQRGCASQVAYRLVKLVTCYVGRMTVKHPVGLPSHKPLHEPKTYTQQLQQLQKPAGNLHSLDLLTFRKYLTVRDKKVSDSTH